MDFGRRLGASDRTEHMNTKDLIRLGVPPGEPTRRGMEFISRYILKGLDKPKLAEEVEAVVRDPVSFADDALRRSEEHTSELQSHSDLVCRLLLEKKNKQKSNIHT